MSAPTPERVSPAGGGAQSKGLATPGPEGARTVQSGNAERPDIKSNIVDKMPTPVKGGPDTRPEGV